MVTDAATVQFLWAVKEFPMTQPTPYIPHEQRKIERLLLTLSKKRPVSAKPAPSEGQSATGTAHRRVFFST